MPVYSYICTKCHHCFELFFSYNNYTSEPECVSCKSKKTERNYSIDLSTINGTIKKSDSELKTIGDIANRNRDRLSEDEKVHLYNKHNEYKEEADKKPLPKGMKRMKKTKGIKWT